ncbi:MAG: ATP-binding domain-containing protein [Clostridiaceae bacterium]|nr:ATP-binding domain-containing protein [Clostridiaceae bacterium]
MLETLLENTIPEYRKGNVTLTTIHSSKGLEYDLVIMLDLSNTEIPGKYALNTSKNSKDDSLLEEERRLFYVGMTRAREYLYLVYPENRNGAIEPESLFVSEVSACINSEAIKDYGEGVIVVHKKFGKGVIAAIYEKNNGQTLLEIDFAGTRRNLDFLTCMENGLLTVEQ